jgi:hypothetical protein
VASSLSEMSARNPSSAKSLGVERDIGAGEPIRIRIRTDEQKQMRRFVEGMDRGQATLFPECLEDWIDENNPVRVIDAFVDKLDLSGLGFDGVAPEATGRPSYHRRITAARITWSSTFSHSQGQKLTSR